MKLTRVRVTHEVAATRDGGQGIHNVVLLDRGRPERDLAGELVIATFSAAPSYIRGPVPREIAENPYLLLERATARDLERSPGQIHMFGGVEKETEEPTDDADNEEGEEQTTTAEQPNAEQQQPAGDQPPPPPPLPPAAAPQPDRRSALTAELAALPWPALLERAAAAGVKTHARKRPLVERELLKAELEKLEK